MAPALNAEEFNELRLIVDWVEHTMPGLVPERRTPAEIRRANERLLKEHSASLKSWMKADAKRRSKERTLKIVKYQTLKARAVTKQKLRKATRREFAKAFEAYLNGGDGAVIESFHRRRGIRITRHDLSEAAGAYQ